MKAHIGVKIINALAMTLGEYIAKGLLKPSTAYSEDTPGYLVEYTDGGTAKVLPCITMKTATDEILMGWLASQTDMLAEDWVIVE